MTNLPEETLRDLLTGDLSDWLEALPIYQGEHLTRMLATSTPSEVAKAWLTSTGPKDTAPFGALQGGAALFYGNLLKEMQKLLCGTESYHDEKKQLATIGNTSKLAVVSIISIAIGPEVGAAAVIIAPAVAITLAVLSNAGRQSACDALAIAIAEAQQNGATGHAD